LGKGKNQKKEKICRGEGTGKHQPNSKRGGEGTVDRKKRGLKRVLEKKGCSNQNRRKEKERKASSEKNLACTWRDRGWTNAGEKRNKRRKKKICEKQGRQGIVGEKEESGQKIANGGPGERKGKRGGWGKAIKKEEKKNRSGPGPNWLFEKSKVFQQLCRGRRKIIQVPCNG